MAPVVPPAPVHPDLIEDLELDKQGQVRKFKDMDLQAYIDSKVAELSAGKTGAVVAYWTPQYGFRAAVVGKAALGSGELAWTVTATKAKAAPLELELGVRYSW